MARLSIVMGIFLATSVTSIVMLMALSQNISSSVLLYRGIIIFFIFGFLGTFFGSVLEVIFMPVLEEDESKKLREEISGENKDIHVEIGDLLDDYKLNQNEIGTPTDEPSPETAIDDNSNSTVVS